jgi:hypothetical protein
VKSDIQKLIKNPIWRGSASELIPAFLGHGSKILVVLLGDT